MKIWLTRLRARCQCGCSFESFALPPEEAKGRHIARTRSGFAAFLIEDGDVLAEIRRQLAAAGQPEAPDAEVIRLAGLLGNPAPDGRPYDTALGPVCPRCEATDAELRVDKQLPEVVLALPVLTHRHWLTLPAAEQQAALLAALTPAQSPVRS